MNIKIAESLIPYLSAIHEGVTVSDKVNLSAVIGLFALRIITLEKAAELTELSIWDYIDVLNAYKIPWGEYSDESIRMDDIAIKNMIGESA